ncbi:hypothetical protein M758_UG146900 [Ceratodon purpureus]|nr:hypothetical protein M758_UG146900 [Ceratodon purpureus]
MRRTERGFIIFLCIGGRQGGCACCVGWVWRQGDRSCVSEVGEGCLWRVEISK